MTARGKLALIGASIALATGCAAGKSTFHIMQAERAIDNAEERGADELSLYEYTMASRYLIKAREEHTYSSFRDSERLARAAADYADQAIISMEERGTNASMDEDVSNMVEEREVAAPVEDITQAREEVTEPVEGLEFLDDDFTGDDKPAAPEPEEDETIDFLDEEEDDGSLDFLDEEGE